MDNFFEILIYLIIIISFLSSIFKKKQTQQKSPPARQPETDEHYQTDPAASQSQSKEYDILRELEDFFKTGEQPVPRRTSRPQETESLPSADEHVQTESWKEPTRSEHVTDDWESKKTEVKKIISRIDPATEKKAAVFEESSWKKEPVYNEFALSIRSKFRNAYTLKEYIIFSEILGKPKALRR